MAKVIQIASVDGYDYFITKRESHNKVSMTKTGRTAPKPQIGQLAYDPKGQSAQIYDGKTWVPLTPLGPSVMTGLKLFGTDVYMDETLPADRVAFRINPVCLLMNRDAVHKLAQASGGLSGPLDQTLYDNAYKAMQMLNNELRRQQWGHRRD